MLEQVTAAMSMVVVITTLGLLGDLVASVKYSCEFIHAAIEQDDLLFRDLHLQLSPPLFYSFVYWHLLPHIPFPIKAHMGNV
jgi:hypothetical protein